MRKKAAYLTAVAAAAAAIQASVASGAAESATVLTVSGNTLVAPGPMSSELKGVLCKEPNTCVKVDYPAWAIGAIPIVTGYWALENAVSSTSGQKIVMAYSQGAMSATYWLQYNSWLWNAPSSSDLTFVLVGNPQRLLNGQAPTLHVGAATPSLTKYKVIDVCREYDAECDFPNNPFNLLALANAALGYLMIHLNYNDVDVNDPDNLVTTIGNTTYELVPTERLPLLEPLRWIGLSSLADLLEEPVRFLVDLGYTTRWLYHELGDETLLSTSTSTTDATSMSVSTTAATLSATTSTVSDTEDVETEDASTEEAESDSATGKHSVDSENEDKIPATQLLSQLSGTSTTGESAGESGSTETSETADDTSASATDTSTSTTNTSTTDTTASDTTATDTTATDSAASTTASTTESSTASTSTATTADTSSATSVSSTESTASTN